MPRLIKQINFPSDLRKFKKETKDKIFVEEPQPENILQKIFSWVD